MATLLMLGLAIGVWMFQSAGFLQVSRTQKKLTAIRAAHILFERLHRDLKSAQSLLILPPQLAKSKDGRELAPTTAFFIDGEEYLFDPNVPSLIIGGQPWILGRLESLSLESAGDGRVWIRIVALSDEDLQSASIADRARPSRAVMEGLAVVEDVRDREHYPFVLAEERDLHAFCSQGDPIDY